LTFSVPPHEPGASIPLCQLELKYFDAVNATSMKATAEVRVDIVDEISPDLAVDNEHVAAQLGRLSAVEAMERANTLGKEGRFVEGRELLSAVRSSLQDTPDCASL